MGGELGENMAEYKVRIDDKVYKVSGLAGLVQLIQNGRLKETDAVFVPRSGKWHYASSIRQLREHFDARKTQPSMAAPPVPAPTPTPGPTPTTPPRGNGSANGAGVTRAQAPRRPVSNDPIDIPVYHYEIDEETPAWVRRAFLGVIVVFIGIFLFAWVVTEKQRYAEDIAKNPTLTATKALRTHQPRASRTRPPHTPDEVVVRGTTTPKPRTSSAKATPTPVVIDIRTLRSDLNQLPKRRPSSLAELEKQMVEELLKLKVPVRAVKITEPKAKKAAVVPFKVQVAYVHNKKRADYNRVAIGLVIGRTMEITKLNVGTVVLQEYKQDKLVRRYTTTGVSAQQLYQRWNTSEFLGSLRQPSRKKR